MPLLQTITILGIFWACFRIFVVPPHLRHLPRVPIIPLILSYACAETEDRRTLRLFLPCAHKHQSGLVLVWTFGFWTVHCVHPQAGKIVMENRHFDKQIPPEGMLFWRFVGTTSIIVINDAHWRQCSKPIRSALSRSAMTCIPQFVALSRKLVETLDNAQKSDRSGKESVRRICWSDLTHRFSLDAIGTTVLGYDFKALECPDSLFVAQYQRVMHDIANPLYVFLPILEALVPRKRVVRDIEELVHALLKIMKEKEVSPGNDIISYMLEYPLLTSQERRDNMVTLFMAGHDTTAGSLSTLIYCFAKYPKYQHLAREEVFRVLGNSTELNSKNLSKLPYLQACIREGLRFHNPSTTTTPRIAQVAVDVCGYSIPPSTPILLNMFGVHHNPSVWQNPEIFDPDRFYSYGSDLATESSNGGDNTKDCEVDNGWVPFGLGFRSCPARTFSLIEQKTLLIILLREYHWCLPHESIHFDYLHVAFSVFALNLPDKLDIIFTKLNNGKGK